MAPDGEKTQTSDSHRDPDSLRLGDQVATMGGVTPRVCWAWFRVEQCQCIPFSCGTLLRIRPVLRNRPLGRRANVGSLKTDRDPSAENGQGQPNPSGTVRWQRFLLPRYDGVKLLRLRIGNHVAGHSDEGAGKNCHLVAWKKRMRVGHFGASRFCRPDSFGLLA
jgi:hypothetical protein